MGKPCVTKNCLRCNKTFRVKPQKVITIIDGEREKHYVEEVYCQVCRHLKTKSIKRVKAKDLGKVNLKDDVEMLKMLEHYNPKLVDKLREGKKK